MPSRGLTQEYWKTVAELLKKDFVNGIAHRIPIQTTLQKDFPELLRLIHRLFPTNHRETRLLKS